MLYKYTPMLSRISIYIHLNPHEKMTCILQPDVDTDNGLQSLRIPASKSFESGSMNSSSQFVKMRKFFVSVLTIIFY